MVDWISHGTFAEYPKGLPQPALTYTQLGASEWRLSSRRVGGGRCTLLQVRCKPLSLWSCLPTPGWFALLAPVSWRGDCVVQGLAAEPGSVFLIDGDDGFFTRAAERENLVLTLRKDDVRAAAAALQGDGGGEVSFATRRLDCGGGGQARLRAIASRALDADDFADASRPAMSGAMSGAMERDLIAAATCWLLDHAGPPPPSPSRSAGAVAVARRMEERLCDADGATLSLTDLCRAGGVGKSRLSECLAEVHGMSPYRYLLNRRLSSAHRRLSDAEAPATSVKDVALDEGFVCLGRFSGQYAQLFAEKPSETLARARDAAR